MTACVEWGSGNRMGMGWRGWELGATSGIKLVDSELSNETLQSGNES